MRKLPLLLLAAFAPMQALAADRVDLDNHVFLERVTTDANGRERVLLEEPKVVVPGDRLVFVARDEGVDRLWVLAGAAAPAVVEPGGPEPYDGPCCALVRGQETFFQAADSLSSYRLWRHDGVAPPAPVSSTFEVGGLQFVSKSEPISATMSGDLRTVLQRLLRNWNYMIVRSPKGDGSIERVVIIDANYGSSPAKAGQQAVGGGHDKTMQAQSGAPADAQY